MATKLQVYNDALVLLGDARIATLSDDVAGRYELDNLYDRAVLYVTRQAAWNHAIKFVFPTAGAASYHAFAYSYAKPGDWLRTHSIYTQVGTREYPIDARELATTWALNVNTGVCFRYIASGVAESLWTEGFVLALAAYLAFAVAERVSGKGEKASSMFQLWQARLAEGAAMDAQPDSEWLPFQLDGSMVKAARTIAEDGLWNFAEKRVAPTASTSTVSGYSYRYLKPADWIRTIDLYEPNGTEDRYDIPWIDDGGYLHTNSPSGVLRYVASTNIDDPSKWPDQFAAIVLALLHLQRTANNPNASGAGLAARQQVYQSLLHEAKAKDSARSRTRVNNTGVIVRSRFGTFYGEQGRRY
jgi:hypothetical protein